MYYVVFTAPVRLYVSNSEWEPLMIAKKSCTHMADVDMKRLEGVLSAPRTFKKHLKNSPSPDPENVYML
jgi:hypothetical protein